MNKIEAVSTEIEKKINYLYFGFVFFCLLFVHGFHALLLESTPLLCRMSFLITVSLQCFLEVVLLLLIAQIIQRLFSKKLFYSYIALTFLLLIAQIIDFFLIRILDLSVWFGFGLVKEEPLENFIQILKGSSVSLSVWASFAAISLLLPVGGVVLFILFDKWGKTRKISSLKRVVALLLVTFALLSFWDVTSIHTFAPQTYEQLRKTLPFKTAFFGPEWESLPLDSTLALEREEKSANLDELKMLAVRKPDIYLFVIESLREDFLNEETAPHLVQFKKENISCDLSVSSANATHLSWYSIFHSKFPFYWSEKLPKEKKGSIPIALLKKMGYSVSVYATTGLKFYAMDERIFGENHQLADQIFDFSEERVTHQSDSNAIEKLLEEMRASKGNGGHLHIISLDSTHFDYSWPKETGSLFLPVKEEIDYFKAAYSKSEMEGIKNRYRNAIHHVDSLLGRFFEELKKQGKDKDALVVVTGDHGQEFFEDEHLFHASTLNAAQTQVPIYYKFGDGSKLPSRGRARLTSHIDIFPTLLHYICQKDLDLKVIQGESIFKDEKWAYVISARYNGSKKPTEFFIHNGKNKITLRFNEKDIFHSSQLSILSVKDLYDKNIPHDKSTIRGEFGGAFNRLFSTQ